MGDPEDTAGRHGGTEDDSGGADGRRWRYPPEAPRSRRRRLVLAGVLLALFAGYLGYRVLSEGGLEQTALFYVGLPAVIALTVVVAARPRSAVGTAMATVTVGLALAGPLLAEGVVCLLMAAPLFYLVALFVGVAANEHRSKRGMSALITVPVLLAACLEGVAGIEYLPRPSEGGAERVVPAAPHEVAAALAAEPEYSEPESAFLRVLPFPRPRAAEGTGLHVGGQRSVAFNPRRSLGIGTRPTPRSMRLAVTESAVGPDGGRVLFTVVHDDTLARWLDLREAEVEWSAAPGGTRVAWTLRYDRTFDPSWYWGPIQDYAVDRAAGYLLDTFSTPGTASP
ncbi:hypothetical protein CLV63_117127 [Murinocardiopsis flavida]|uniref:Uncharacterized protein n=1 Tax=Murinocardiopsis flavida TaxID=645275 RepID=A0A2P8D6T0_9ACTN|nr:hypothetical protein [Murinocardiopsis flavida]PSK92918.1 hypothetical protein CLV63_117127 [Murinocardiopsis flavida]